VNGAGADAAVSHREPNYLKQQVAALVPNTGFNSILEILVSRTLAHDFVLAGESGRTFVIGSLAAL
jgi:NADPH:quinone reductase-like Zn-dependent oxidoreductase